MDRPIALNYETGFAAKEICQILTELMLSSELKPQKTPIAQKLPQQFFSVSLLLSQFASERKQTSNLITTAVLPLFPQPI